MVDVKSMLEYTKSLNILIIDDDETFIEYFKINLNRLFNKVFVAYSGEEAIKIWTENQKEIDIIVTDIQMPNMSGFDVAKTIRDKFDNDIPIIIVSAGGIYEDFNSNINLFITLSINGFLAKPLDKNSLYKILHRVSKNRFESLVVEKYQQDLEHTLDMLVKSNSELTKLSNFFKKFAKMLPSEQKKEILSKLLDSEPHWRPFISSVCSDFESFVDNNEKQQISSCSITKFSDKISAEEYLEKIEFDRYFKELSEDIVKLTEYAEDIYDMLDVLDEDLFSNLSTIFQKYSSMLMMFAEFYRLSSAINRVSNFFTQYTLEDIGSKTDMKRFATLLKYFMVDLESWKNHVFVYRNAQDIHYFDEQAESFCLTIESIFNDKNEEDDLELF